MKFFFPLILLSNLYSCSRNTNCEKEINKVSDSFLDSIRKNSDTSYSKRYRNRDFVTADYYLNKKNNIICQIMKDSLQHVRQIIIARSDIRAFTAEYYPNGQLMASLPLDDKGKYHGEGKYYYADGCIKSRGHFQHGFHYGEWKNYDPKGALVSVDKYDSGGKLIKSDKY